jgi:hypothetical protein
VYKWQRALELAGVEFTDEDDSKRSRLEAQGHEVEAVKEGSGDDRPRWFRSSRGYKRGVSERGKR